MSIEKIYTVYMHIFPNNKKYIGQTSLLPNHRWHSNGSGYLTKRDGKYWQPLMAYAVNKYGWDSVKHIILARVNSLEESNRLEEFYIALYNTSSKDFGYNTEYGGNNYKRRCGNKASLESRLKMSLAKKGKPLPHLHNKEVYEKIGNSLRGRKYSDKRRKQCSESHKGQIPWNKGKKASNEAKLNQSKSHKGLFWFTNGIVDTQARVCPEGFYRGRSSNKGKSLSMEHREKISAGNKGKKVSEEARKKLSESHKGKKVSESTRKHLSEALKGRKFPEHLKKQVSEYTSNLRWYNDGIKNIRINKDLPVPEGFKPGVLLKDDNE